MRAKDIINEYYGDETDPEYGIWDAIEEVEMSSSSHAGYDSQEEKWREVAQKLGTTLTGLVDILAQQKKPISEGFDGLEGLWELTKDPRLEKHTDYVMAETWPESANILHSYLYGGQRLAKFKAYGDVTFEKVLREFAEGGMFDWFGSVDYDSKDDILKNKAFTIEFSENTNEMQTFVEFMDNIDVINWEVEGKQGSGAPAFAGEPGLRSTFREWRVLLSPA